MSTTTSEVCGQGDSDVLVDKAKSLAVILGEEFSVPFTLYDATSGEVVWPLPDPADTDWDSRLDPTRARQLAGESRAQVSLRNDGCYVLELPLGDGGRTTLIGACALPALAPPGPDAVVERQRLTKWAQAVCDRLMTARPFLSRRRTELQGAGPGAAWEAVGALEQLVRHLRVHKESGRNQKLILQTAAELLRAQTLVWVSPQSDAAIIVGDESCLSSWDCQRLADQLRKEPDLTKNGFFLGNRIAEAGWGVCFPQIESLMVLAIRASGPPNLVIAINKQEGRTTRRMVTERAKRQQTTEFSRGDAALLTPFVALLELHVSAARRFHDLKDLLVGLTRSLTAAIDAKDAYTYGHSERVGRIAVELGRELGLKDDQLSDLYLAGLLHDIGKIGTRDEVLGKRGSLTPEEREHLQQHVTIGYAILADLNPIRHLLPAVLHHHERFDGTGYPEGLKGNAIPMIARILAVADGFDAMSTNRPYRAALTPERVEEILLEGAGTQWDRQVVEAFMRCRLKVRAVRQRGVGESLRQAINGALREENSSLRPEQ